MPRMVRIAAAFGLVASGLVLAGGCHGGATPVDPLAPRSVIELQRWRVSVGDPAAGDRTVGFVVEKEIRDPAGPIRFFHVESPKGQWVGYLDALGRVYRREVFATVERFVGMYPMEKALELLYDEAGPLRMTPAQLGRAPLEASMTDPDR